MSVVNSLTSSEFKNKYVNFVGLQSESTLCNQEVDVSINRGPVGQLYTNYKAVSPSTNGVSINVPSITASNFVDKRIDANATLVFKVDYTGNVADENPSAGVYLNEFPLNSLIQVATVSINGVPFAQNNGKLFDSLKYTISDRLRKNRSHPANMSRFRKNSDAVDTQLSQTGYGTASSVIDIAPNGAYPYEKIGNGFSNNTVTGDVSTAEGAGSFYVEYKIDEILMLPGFNGFDCDNTEPYTGITSLDIELSFKQVSHDYRPIRCENAVVATKTGATISSVTLEAVKSFSMRIKTTTAGSNVKIPRYCVSSYPSYTRYISESSDSIPANSQGKITVSNEQFSAIPHTMLLSVTQRVDANHSDAFLPIVGGTMCTIENDTQLQSFSTLDLYKASRKAGLNMDYLQYNGVAAIKGAKKVLTGGPTLLRLSDDLLLTSGVVPNMQNQPINISFELNVANNTAAATTGQDVLMCGISREYLVISGGNCFNIKNVITSDDVRRMVEKGTDSTVEPAPMTMTGEGVTAGGMRGGSMFSNFVDSYEKSRPSLIYE